MDISQLEAILHLGSKHLTHDVQDAYNESNPGLGFRAPIGNKGWDIGAGGYKNSLGNTSLYGGVGKEFLTLGDILGLRLNAGLISGYQDSLLPFLIPELRMKLLGDSNLLLQYIPKMKHNDFQTDATLGLGLSIPFK